MCIQLVRGSSPFLLCIPYCSKHQLFIQHTVQLEACNSKAIIVCMILLPTHRVLWAGILEEVFLVRQFTKLDPAVECSLHRGSQYHNTAIISTKLVRVCHCASPQTLSVKHFSDIPRPSNCPVFNIFKIKKRLRVMSISMQADRRGGLRLFLLVSVQVLKLWTFTKWKTYHLFGTKKTCMKCYLR